MKHPRGHMMPPRKLRPEEVRSFVGQFMVTVPSDLTLKDALTTFIEQFADLSDRITIQQQSNMLSLWAIVAKYAAANDLASSTQVVLGMETRQ